MNILKTLRLRKEKTQKDIANYLDISIPRYSNYETGARQPDFDIIKKLATYYDVSTDFILGHEVEKNTKSNNSLARINVLGSIPAGVPIEAVEDIVDWEEIPAEWLKKGEYFALKIKGDSMSPTFLDGDIVVFKKQPDVDSGEYAAVFVNGYDATFKKVIKNESGNIILQPLNTDYDPIYVNQDEYFQILGKPVQARRNFY